ncbi:MAG: MBL fold metallo-hydrolase [Clostridiales bacterium]|nr:MBL fold metallo-hydrolase [Clostridiales bacterium]
MKLHVLGCHGPWPGANGATSGYLVEHAGKALLMDCGSGIMGRLMAKWDPRTLEGVLLSHLHFDHACDLLVMRYYLEKAGAALPVYVPGEDQSPLRSLLTGPAFDVRPYPEVLEIMGLTVSTFPVRHPVPCRAIRLSDGEKTLVFTGDTNDCPGLGDFARDADALLADAAFLASEWHENLPHMSAAGAARLAMDAHARALYLTHLPHAHSTDTMEAEAKTCFPGAKAVQPGTVIAL